MKFLAVYLVAPVFAAASVVSSGTATIPGTFSFDFDAGVVDDYPINPPADVFWEQLTSTTRALDRANGASIVNLDTVSFASVSLQELEGLAYGTTGIDGSDLGNVLVPGICRSHQCR